MSFTFRNGQAVVSVDQDTEGALSRVLHQATQPLTVIHGTLELALLTANTMEKYREAVELSLEELKRITDCFRDLRAMICQPQPALDVAELCGITDGEKRSWRSSSSGRTPRKS
jgi:hypothetical protein